MKKAPKPNDFKALSWRRKRDSNFKIRIFSFLTHIYKSSKSLIRKGISKPWRFMCVNASKSGGGKTRGIGGSKNFVHPDTLSMNFSILFALSCFIFSVTCPYTSRVKAAVACPRFICTVFTSSPSEREVTAYEWRRS